MAWALVQEKGQGAVNSAVLGSRTLVYDSTPTEGNLLFASVVAVAGHTWSGSGWTFISTSSDYPTEADADGGIWWKIAGAGEPTSYTVTADNSSARVSAHLFEYSGVDVDNPVDASRGINGTVYVRNGGWSGAGELPDYQGGLYVAISPMLDVASTSTYHADTYPAEPYPTDSTRYVDSHRNGTDTSKCHLNTYTSNTAGYDSPGQLYQYPTSAGGTARWSALTVTFRKADAAPAGTLVSGTPPVTFIVGRTGAQDAAGTTVSISTFTPTLNDLLVAVMVTEGGGIGDTVTSPGWTSLYQGDGYYALWRWAAAGAQSHTFTWGGSSTFRGVVLLQFRGHAGAGVASIESLMYGAAPESSAEWTGFGTLYQATIAGGVGGYETHWGTSRHHVKKPQATNAGIGIVWMMGRYSFATMGFSSITSGWAEGAVNGANSTEFTALYKLYDTGEWLHVEGVPNAQGAGTTGIIFAGYMLAVGVPLALEGGNSQRLELQLHKMTAAELPYQVHTRLL